MGTSVEKILSEFVARTAKHFNLDPMDALAAVVQTKLANEISKTGNIPYRSMDQLCIELYNEIAKAE